MAGLKYAQMKEQYDDITDELELKNKENNRLRNQVADLEKVVSDLYGSRKGEGSMQVI